MEIKYHTLAHILLGVLKEVLSDTVEQKGYNASEERLRFDFSFERKLTDEEKLAIEDKVNEIIKSNTDVVLEEMSYDDAKKSGAHGIFTNKYEGLVKVYTIGSYSKELCGGPHVSNTSELGVFKIAKEESSSAGVRRIKGILS